MPDPSPTKKPGKAEVVRNVVSFLIIAAAIGIVVFVWITMQRSKVEGQRFVNDVLPYTSWCGTQANLEDSIPDDYDCDGWLERFKSEHADIYNECHPFGGDISLFNSCMDGSDALSTLR